MSPSERLCIWCKTPLPKANRLYCGHICQQNWTTERLTKTCLVCGEPFRGQNSQAKYCSRTCTYVGKRKPPVPPRRCEECGKEYTPKAWSAEARSRFCSNGCKARQTNRGRAGKVATGHWAKFEHGGLPHPQFLLWQALGANPVGWYAQFWMTPLGEIPGRMSFTVDVANPVEKIAVEVDGLSHTYNATTVVRDRHLEDWMVGQGWTVLRFSNREVLDGLPSVVTAIRSRCTT